MVKPRVLFVGGYGRSGSTLIDLALGSVPGIVPVGEFRHLFGRALGDNELCSCGRQFQECPFWAEVIAMAFPAGLDRAEVHEAMQAVNRVAALPRIKFEALAGSAFRRSMQIYGEALAAAYQAVLDVTGGDVIVDSSKYPVHGLFLRAGAVVDLRVMLLVRDARAVAYSWTRKRIRPEVHWTERHMPQHSLLRSSAAWSASNYLTGLLDDGSTPFRLQRYEDFVADPDGQLAEIASFALGAAPAAQVIFGAAPEGETHTVAGNPLRLAGDRLEVRPDVAWKGALSAAQQTMIAMTSPVGMRRFGYPLGPQRD